MRNKTMKKEQKNKNKNKNETGGKKTDLLKMELMHLTKKLP